MTGLLLTLHCGLFHVLSIAWRFAGIDAKPIVRAPLLASSLTDFWGRRWNLAFRDLAHHYVFRPLASRLGIAGATMTVFLLSGIVHDLVISVPVNAGFGWPTIYFLLQGIALLAERSRLGQHLGLGRGWTGRAFAALVVLAPLGLLFHQAFVLQGVLPTIIAIRGR